MNIYVSWSLTGLYYLVYPVYFLLYFITLTLKTLLTPLSSVLLFILQPLFLFARLLVYCIVAPFHFLARFEVNINICSCLPHLRPRILSIKQYNKYCNYLC
jgi:hypothetical protein